MFELVFTGVVSIYFTGLILLFLLRTSLVLDLSKNTNNRETIAILNGL
jgi:hypothetical protein